MRNRLLKVIVLGNLVTSPEPRHTRLTYHRTWETGLGVADKPLLLTPIFIPCRSIKHLNSQ
jgi:hypothetical protein